MQQQERRVSPESHLQQSEYVEGSGREKRVDHGEHSAREKRVKGEKHKKNKEKPEEDSKRHHHSKKKQAAVAHIFLPEKKPKEAGAAEGRDAGVSAGLRLLDLPDAILLRTMSFLSVQHWARLARVSKRFWELLRRESTWHKIRVWKLWYKVDEQFVRELCVRHANHVQKLDLSWSRNLTDSAVEHIASSCAGKSLTTLKINYCTQLSDEGIIALTDSLKLRTLTMRFVPVTDQVFIHMARRWAESLQALDMSECMNVTDEGIMALVSGCRSVSVLNISSCPFVTDQGIIAILKGCPKLRRLELTGSKYITADVFKALLNCEVLKRLTLKNCEFSEDEFNEFVRDKPRSLFVKR